MSLGEIRFQRQRASIFLNRQLVRESAARTPQEERSGKMTLGEIGVEPECLLGGHLRALQRNRVFTHQLLYPQRISVAQFRVGRREVGFERDRALEQVDRDGRSEEHTSELQSPCNLVCRLLLEKKKKIDLTWQRNLA